MVVNVKVLARKGFRIPSCTNTFGRPSQQKRVSDNRHIRCPDCPDSRSLKHDQCSHDENGNTFQEYYLLELLKWEI